MQPSAPPETKAAPDATDNLNRVITWLLFGGVGLVLGLPALGIVFLLAEAGVYGVMLATKPFTDGTESMVSAALIIPRAVVYLPLFAIAARIAYKRAPHWRYVSWTILALLAVLLISPLGMIAALFALLALIFPRY